MKHRHMNRLQQLREANHQHHQAQQAMARTMNNQEEPDVTTVYLYDVIDSDPYWGFTATEMAQVLESVTTPVIRLRINSPGGDVFEARTMATLLSQHPARIEVAIDGWAASAATTVAIAGDTIEMVEGGFFMIHKAWLVAAGNADYFSKIVNELDQVDAAIAADYARRTGGTTEAMMEYMTEETWFSAQEALEVGFIDSVWTPESDNANARIDFDLSAYANAPTRAERTPRTAAAAAATEMTINVNVDGLDQLEDALKRIDTVSDILNTQEDDPENPEEPAVVGVPDRVRRMAAIL